MKHRLLGNNLRRTAVGGFSLVELLTVIAIIVLLIGILVPAVNKVRITARTTATKALIGTFSTGLETFRADQQVGGRYPPSVSDMTVAGNLDPYQVQSPYGNLENPPEDEFEISGAGLLVWALAGADLLGTPGFRTFRDGNTHWSEDTDADTGGAYELETDTRQPLRSRVAPFVEVSKVELTSWNAQAETDSGFGSFEIPAETQASEALGLQPARRNYPVFLDSFGGPILYCRADPAGQRLADRSGHDTTGPDRGVYHFLDNGALFRSDIGGGPGTNQAPIVLRAANADNPHRIFYIETLGDFGTDNQAGFWLYIQNKHIQARLTPHNSDTYLLFSAGADGVFGTGDDVANFDHNGAELQDR